MELQLPLLYLVGLKPGVFEPVFPSYVVDDDPATLSGHARGEAAAASGPVRFLVIGAYREQCAMCRLKHVALLEAAHPARYDVRGLPEVPNGLSLCRIHHGAFDIGILGVAPDYKIHLRQDVLEEHDGPMLKHGLQEIHGSKIVLPSRVSDRPKAEYLEERFDKFRAA